MPDFTEQKINELRDMALHLEENGTSYTEKLTAANTLMLIDGAVTPEACGIRCEEVLERSRKYTDRIVSGMEARLSAKIDKLDRTWSARSRTTLLGFAGTLPMWVVTIALVAGIFFYLYFTVGPAAGG